MHSISSIIKHICMLAKCIKRFNACIDIGPLQSVHDLDNRFFFPAIIQFNVILSFDFATDLWVFVCKKDNCMH